LDRLSGRDVEISSEFTEKEIEILLGGHTNVVVRRRRGQRAFRFALMQRYGERCAFSGAQPPQVLEAAHIYRFADRPEHRSDGGLLLRRDCHALFDANLIAVNPHTLKIEVAPVLERYPTYQKLKDAPLQVQEASMPSLELIESHYRQSLTVFANN
jgi:predicted restriction endonuclease